MDVLGKVDDWLDDHLGVGVGAPGADLLDGDQPVVVLHSRDPGVRAGDGCLREVHVEHHLPRPRSDAEGLVVGLRDEVEGELGTGKVAGGQRTAYVEGLSAPAAASDSARALMAASRSRASARSSSASTNVVPSKETCW